jgi:hypothetical protein
MFNGYIGDPIVNFNHNNPFLEMIAALDDAGGQEQQVQAGPPAENIVGRFKLPDFWPHAPGIWFARAELRFEVGGVVSERQRFAFTVDALPYEALCLVADLVESPPVDQPYTVLKDRLLIAHQLTPVEKAVKLMAAPDLGDRRPSQLLADLLQLCPPGEQSTAFFRGSFLKRLPNELQVHLAGTETTDLKELAQRADQLWVSYRRPAYVAALAAEPAVDDAGAVIAAVSKSATAAAAGQKKKKKLVTYCFLHHKYGKAARKCEDPANCMWSEN